MHNDSSEQNTRRRIVCEKCRIHYLTTLVESPHTNKPEIERRTKHILEMKACIQLHEKAIEKLRNDPLTAVQDLSKAKTRLVGLQRAQNKALIAKWIAEYIEIHNRLEEVNDASAVSVS